MPPRCSDNRIHMMKEVAVSWNYINKGHHARPYAGRAIVDGEVRTDLWFIPSEQRFQQYVSYGNPAEIKEQYIERLKKLYDVCRIWIHYEDGSKKNIWYYGVD